MSYNIPEARASLDKKLDDVNANLSTLNYKQRDNFNSRIAYISEEAKRMLPDFSKNTESYLAEVAPDFVTEKVHKIFKSNRKLLGVFKRRNSDNALWGLHISLKSYLNSCKWRELRHMDDSIEIVQNEINSLNQERVTLIKTINSLRDLSASGKKPSPRLRLALTKSSQNNITPSSKARLKRIQEEPSYQPDYQENDDLDLLKLLIIEQQMFGQTGTIDSVHGGGGTFDGGGASGNWDSGPMTNPGCNIDLISAVVGAGVIATDDSLGTFS